MQKLNAYKHINFAKQFTPREAEKAEKRQNACKTRKKSKSGAPHKFFYLYSNDEASRPQSKEKKVLKRNEDIVSYEQFQNRMSRPQLPETQFNTTKQSIAQHTESLARIALVDKDDV